MNRYPVTWGPFLGQAAGTDVVCEGGVCKITPVGQPTAAPAPIPTVPITPIPVAVVPADTSVGGIPLPWLAVGAAAGVGLIILAVR